MGNGFEFWDIILVAMIAAFIGLRLYSVLGRRTGNEPPASPDGLSPRRTSLPDAASPDYGQVPSHAEEEIRRYADAPEIRKGLEEILRLDPSFDVEGFIDGAQKAHELILEAFWAGKLEEVEPFLSKKVRDGFLAAVDARESAGHTLENRIVDRSACDIETARVTGGVAEIVVRFVSNIINIIRDRDGNLVEGDLSDTVQVTDIWTFAREPASADPNWTLVATRAG